MDSIILFTSVQLSDFDVTHRVTATAYAIDHVPSCCFYRGHPFGFTELLKLIPKTGMIPNDALVNELHKERFFREQSTFEIRRKVT